MSCTPERGGETGAVAAAESTALAGSGVLGTGRDDMAVLARERERGKSLGGAGSRAAEKGKGGLSASPPRGGSVGGWLGSK